jgi:hypothetical protein
MLSFKQHLGEKLELLLMSAASDRYEQAVAVAIDSIDGVTADRPKVSTKYADVLVKLNGKKTWLEVKMNHTDNLGNTRVSYVDGKWTAAAPLDPVKNFAIEYLSKDRQTQQFLKDIAEYAGITNWKNMTVPSTQGYLKNKNAVSYEKMKEYLSTRSQYILDVKNVDLGDLVTRHYLEGKAEPAHYMQAGDDFYMIGKANPLGLPTDIPELGRKGQCMGSFKMRIGVRGSKPFYEVQPEIKILNMPKSPYSVKPGTRKLNPFTHQRVRTTT